MIGLLADPRIAEYDILAIQEPWRNRFDAAVYNPRSSPFHTLDLKQPDSRACIYVNKRISVNEWTETFHSPDLCTITLRIAGGTPAERLINTHSVYNPPPISHQDTTDPGTIPALRQALQMPGEHIILGDFNLHHPVWAGPLYPHQHRLADDLLDLMRSTGAELALPQGTITREFQKGRISERTTIDLIFATETLTEQIEHCKVVREIEQSSYHLPIATCFSLETAPEPTPTRKRRAWKKLNVEKFTETFTREVETLYYLDLANRQQINQYTEMLAQAMSKAAEAATPWKQVSEFMKGYWTQECQNVVKTTRRLRRIYSETHAEEDWQRYIQAKDRKGKIIEQAKRRDFRQSMHQASDTPEGIWKIVKWARKRSQKLTDQISIPTLKWNGVEAQDSRSKAELLRQTLFPPPPEADLQDMENFQYPTPVEQVPRLTVEEINRAVKATAKDTASGKWPAWREYDCLWSHVVKRETGYL